jgi:hypothetical protein
MNGSAAQCGSQKYKWTSDLPVQHTMLYANKTTIHQEANVQI